MRLATSQSFDDRACPLGLKVDDGDSQLMTVSREQSTDSLSIYYNFLYMHKLPGALFLDYDSDAHCSRLAASHTFVRSC
jgi:hypothetical protein